MSMSTKARLKNYFSSIPKTIFVFTLILTCMTVTILKTRKNIIVSIDNTQVKITTLRTNLKSILDANGIEIGPKDKISANLNSDIKDGQNIYIKKAIGVKVKVDGKELAIKTAENNLEDMLKAENIKLNEKDKVFPPLDEKIKKDLAVDIIRVNEKIVNTKKNIDFAKEVKKTDDYEKGVKKVIRTGKVGEKVISTKVVYKDGKEFSREIVSQKVTRNPINEILAVGTLGVFRPSRGGKFNYVGKIHVSATAYTGDYNDSGFRDDPYAGRTASGKSARRNKNGYSTIAVDPNVIPLGTKVYVEGYGLAIAEDIGGAIKGNIIDLYMDSYSETMNWGRRGVDVYILK